MTGLALALGLAACEAPPEPPPPCPPPSLIARLPPGTYEGERERTNLCLKGAVHKLILQGGPPADAARAAMARCAAQEAAAVAALAKEGPVWPYQKERIHDELSHLAQVTAVQARARGCGRKSGEAAETL